MHVTSRTAALLLAGALLAGACSSAPGDETASTLPAANPDAQDPAVSQLVDPNEQGAGQAAGGGQPIPVEGDGGIGGDPGDGTVQDLMILDGDRVDVTAVCLVDDTPTYRIDLAGGATVTITDPVGEAANITYVEGDATFTTADPSQVNAQMQPGALSAQGQTLADGEGRYVDTTVDIRDITGC